MARVFVCTRMYRYLQFFRLGICSVDWLLVFQGYCLLAHGCTTAQWRQAFLVLDQFSDVVRSTAIYTKFNNKHKTNIWILLLRGEWILLPHTPYGEYGGVWSWLNYVPVLLSISGTCRWYEIPPFLDPGLVSSSINLSRPSVVTFPEYVLRTGVCKEYIWNTFSVLCIDGLRGVTAL